MFAQLQIVDEEFEIDEPAARELYIERASGRFVLGHFGTHRQHIGAELFRLARGVQHLGDDRGERGPVCIRAGQRACAAQRHMLPGPRFLALIAGKAFKADRQRALRAAGAQADIDFIERTGGGGRGERGDHALGEAVVIQRAAERARAI